MQKFFEFCHCEVIAVQFLADARNLSLERLRECRGRRTTFEVLSYPYNPTTCTTFKGKSSVAIPLLFLKRGNWEN